MKWSYEVEPQRIEGEVEAPDYEAATAATTMDAISKADDAVIAGTWEMRQVEDDGS